MLVALCDNTTVEHMLLHINCCWAVQVCPQSVLNDDQQLISKQVPFA